MSGFYAAQIIYRSIIEVGFWNLQIFPDRQ